MPIRRLHIFVSGMVQGVFFRQGTAVKAKEFRGEFNNFQIVY